MTGTVRTATIDDFSVICQLLHELDDLHLCLRPDVFQAFDGPARPRDAIAHLIDAEDGELFLATVSNEVVGLATIQITASQDAPMFRPRQRAVMDNLVVSQKFQGLGIGTKLLDCAVEWAQSRQLPSIEINVWIDNEAGLSFFTANGFTPFCQRMEMRINEKDGG